MLHFTYVFGIGVSPANLGNLVNIASRKIVVSLPNAKLTIELFSQVILKKIIKTAIVESKT